MERMTSRRERDVIDNRWSRIRSKVSKGHVGRYSSEKEVEQMPCFNVDAEKAIVVAEISGLTTRLSAHDTYRSRRSTASK
jgi:hypothetical protein